MPGVECAVPFTSISHCFQHKMFFWILSAHSRPVLQGRVLFVSNAFSVLLFPSSALAIGCLGWVSFVCVLMCDSTAKSPLLIVIKRCRWHNPIFEVPSPRWEPRYPGICIEQSHFVSQSLRLMDAAYMRMYHRLCMCCLVCVNVSFVAS